MGNILSYCHWDSNIVIDRLYHDNEWGTPVFEDTKQFEFLSLEAMQCGLSWLLMLKKREIFRQCFDNFNYNLIAEYQAQDIERILNTAGMIRSQPKILAIINNAKQFLKIRQEFKTFTDYLWAYSDYKTIVYKEHAFGNVPITNGLATTISKDLKKRGFKYLGPICIYSHLQACGIINDHSVDCHRFAAINQLNDVVELPIDHEIFAKK